MVAEVSERPAEPGEPAPAGNYGRAGRNLPAAIAVGLSLGAIIILTLYLYRPAFLTLVVAAIVVGMSEFCNALKTRNVHPPLIPLAVGATAVLCVGYAVGPHSMVLALLLTLPLILVWRVPQGTDGIVADLSTAVFGLMYLGLLAGFCALLVGAHDGDRRATCYIATVIASDVGGYAAGVLFGKHPMAPKISPKKSWEGLAGSTALCALIGYILMTTLLHAAWWNGVVFGLAMVTVATLGDLLESMIKRDIGIKDMGTLLPGHGGILDRLDSLLPAAPVAWALLNAFGPFHP
jgi:phosphatidate cytidylyltransferase